MTNDPAKNHIGNANEMVPEIERARELLRDVLDSSVDARSYPDGPCLDRELRNEIRAFLANKTVSRDAGADGASKPLNG